MVGVDYFKIDSDSVSKIVFVFYEERFYGVSFQYMEKYFS